MSSRKLVVLVVCFLFATLAITVRLAVAMPSAQEPEPIKPSEPDTGETAIVDNVTEVLTATEGFQLPVEPVAAIMTENFEGAWPATGWELDDTGSNDGGEYLWGKRTCHPHAGSYAGWSVGGGAQGSALSCTATYPNNAYTWAIYGPFDLRGASSASLSFHVWGQTEGGTNCPYDFLYVGSSTDSQQFLGSRYCGDWTAGPDGNGYTRRTFDLAGRLGQSQVWIGFLLRSDFSNVFNGITVDDVALNVEGEITNTPTPTPTVTPTATPTRTPFGPARSRLPLVMNRLVATQTPTTAPTATPTSAPHVKSLYLHSDFTLREQPQSTLSDIAIRPAWPSRSWTYTLDGDIMGNRYHFDLTVYSIVYPASYRIELIVDQGGSMTTLASDTVTVWGTGHYMQTISGLDPAAHAGDQLILRISHSAGAYGGTYIGENTNAHIEIPD